jgi:uncharacterized protein YbjT (DUF2867 family)
MARARRQLALTCKPGGAASLGTRREVFDALARFNTAPDGSPTGGATERLYGPGFTVELATSTDTIAQALLSLNDEDIAWPVLMRLCKELAWSMTDLESGRTFGGTTP